MKVNIDWKNNVVQYQTTNIIILAIGAIFLMVFAYFVFQIVTTNQLIEEARQEQTKLQGEISYFNLARQLTQNDVESYNTLLMRLIPEKEDYFSIIASLERLSLYTGLDVSRYSIDLPEQGNDKYTLSIVGTVPKNILPLFLANYQYGTGRLVTIESMTLNDSDENNVNLILNFYAKPVTTSNILKVGSLSQADINLMEGVEEKMTQGESQASQLEQLRSQVKQQAEQAEQQKVASENARLTGTPIPTPRTSTTPSVSPTRGSTSVTNSPTPEEEE